MNNAVPRDDPANPAYDTIVALLRLRGADAYSIDTEIASLERALSPSSNPVPLVAIVRDLRKAGDLIRSKKDADHEKGQKLLQDALKRLR